jgi:GNAT superfamily N-acetyltransferase
METSDVRFRRKVEEEDGRRVRGVVQSTGFFSAEEADIAVELVVERLSAGPESGYDFLFAELGGGMAGYSCWGRIPGTASSYDLYWIVVRQDLRGRGIGRELMARTEDLIAEAGGTRVYIETSSRGQYESTRSFYGKCGYEAEAVLKDFYAPGDGKVIYRKVLASGDERAPRT